MSLMTRFALAVFALACTSLAFAQQQDFSKVVIKVNKVSDNVYMLESSRA